MQMQDNYTLGANKIILLFEERLRFGFDYAVVKTESFLKFQTIFLYSCTWAILDEFGKTFLEHFL